MKTRNWLVLWSPIENDSTVNQIKVIDAWSSVNQTKSNATKSMIAKLDEYRDRHGEGRIQLVECYDRLYL